MQDNTQQASSGPPAHPDKGGGQGVGARSRLGRPRRRLQKFTNNHHPHDAHAMWGALDGRSANGRRRGQQGVHENPPWSAVLP